jgi:hypothetical protein
MRRLHETTTAMKPDYINGFFECGGVLLSLNLRQLIKDKHVQGVHWGPTVFFTLWGFWNLAYYPWLGQWASFAGGLVVVSVNTLWLALWAYYRLRAERLRRADTEAAYWAEREARNLARDRGQLPETIGLVGEAPAEGGIVPNPKPYVVGEHTCELTGRVQPVLIVDNRPSDDPSFEICRG